MKQLVLQILVIFFYIAAVNRFSQPVNAQNSAELLIKGSDLTSIYDQKSGYDNRGTYTNEFGAWVTLPVNDTLYLALGGNPSAKDGAQVISYKDGSLKSLEVTNKNDKRITEQGISDLLWSSSHFLLIIPGTDPSAGDDWSWGNVYVYNPSSNQLHKYRENSGLEEVVHLRGLEEVNGTFYAVTNASSGDKVKVPQGDGAIFISTDQGKTWQRVTQDPDEASNPSDFLGWDAGDIKSFNNSLYVYEQRAEGAALLTSKDSGGHWQQVNSVRPWTMPRMIIFKDKLVYINATANLLSTIDASDKESLFVLPRRAQYSYNLMATDGNYFYYLADDSKIYFSENLKDWNVFAEISGQTLGSISYWPEKQGFVVATLGLKPDVYLIPQPEPPSEIIKSCSVSINKTSFSDTEKLSVMVNGKSSKSSSEPIRLFLKKLDNTKITPIPTGTTLVENLAAKTNYYQFGESVCLTGNEKSCSKTVDVSSLPVGSYQLHCDLPDQPNSCSGNPNCVFNGGSFGCEGWQSCGQNDFVAFTITKTVKEEPTTQDPDYNKNGVVDIYDYNVLLQNYGKVNCSLNLMGECTLDTADFTKLISAYGK